MSPRALPLVLLLASTSHSAWAGRGFELYTVSSRPEVVSGGDALVELRAPSNAKWIAQLNGRDVTRDFHRAEDSGALLALLTGLKQGKNVLEIRLNGATESALELVSHPIEGPIFSGPHQEPFLCQTDFNGLGPALNSDCDAKTTVQYYYRSTAPVQEDLFETMTKSLQMSAGTISTSLPAGFKPYGVNNPPADVAQTVTSDGQTLPYIVRREIGVINRAVYDIRFLHQPGQPLPTPWTRRGLGWNQRLVYVFGGGCAAAYRQGALLGSASDEVLLAQGYAVATSTLNIFANNCNDVVSAETLSMVKEHFIKSFGAPIHTIGWGGSGGAMQLHLIAQNYPGLLNGIIPSASFPDVMTYLPTTTDCPLLLRAFSKLKQPLTEVQKSAVCGFATWRTCAHFGSHIAARSCNSAIPKTSIYDATERPKGVRCDVYDNEINVLGRDPETGFAARPLDNVGVEYGLAAFNSGKIAAEQFIELNERIGGFDVDGNIMANRTVAPDEVIGRAYQHGLVLTGGGGLPETPIIDWRWYSDDSADAHDSLRPFVTRVRLKAANGTAANQVILIFPRTNALLETLLNVAGDPSSEGYLLGKTERELVQHMDHWLDNIAADRASGTLAEKVARDKPSDLSDTCWATDGEKIAGANVYGAMGRCGHFYPQYSDPRIAAGGPATDDLLKCTLKPINPSDYSQPLGVDQLGRLRAVFPSGVCDYKRPGVGQQMTDSVWQSY